MNKNETLSGLMTKTRQNKARNEILGFQREKPDRKKNTLMWSEWNLWGFKRQKPDKTKEIGSEAMKWYALCVILLFLASFVFVSI